ncbi:KGGVGR-motif variant AAA ATPase, partial [Endothiovibrio diazotrophicus]
MKPFITTFYSFKGGVGRTTLLANVGARLALDGKKVLLWDLDLEAPGLHRIAALTPKAMPKEGFLEWLKAWQGGGARLPLPKARIKSLLQRIRPCPAAAGLEILPAHGEKADFATLYEDIDWHALLVREPARGVHLFAGLLGALAEAGGYHHILLDARTGITDLGGLMGALLPDATVLVGNYARQSSAGLLYVYQALQPAVEGRLKQRERALERLLVASPVPQDQASARKLRAAAWGEAFALGERAAWTEIPFDSRLLFGEELFVLTEPTAPIALRYAEVATRIDDLRQSRELEEAAKTRLEQSHVSLDGGVHGTSKVDGKLTIGQRFEERVARLLALLDYKVEREQLVGPNRVDLVARKRAGFREECYLVECKDWRKPVPKSELEKFRSWLDDPAARALHAEGMFVAAAGYAPAALTYARGQGIHALTPGDLERSLFDFTPYLERIRRQFEADPLARTYVAQRVLLEGEPEDLEGVEALAHATAWAGGEGKRLWLVLGDYGTGKSAFFKRLGYELARNALDDPEAPIPLAIDLKRFPNAIRLESLLQDHLRESLGWHGNPEIFLHLLAAGRLVLLLDAFDEMGTAAVRRSIEEQFRQLATPAARSGETPRANRVLITCRTHFFRDQQQVKRTAAGGLADHLVSHDSALGRVARGFDAAIDELPPFNDAQIDDYMTRRLGAERAAEARAFIERTYDLPNLATRPVMLEMMVTSLPELMAAGGRITPARLYFEYTGQWLRDHSGNHLHTTQEQRLRLLERLAFELWGAERHQIHHLRLIQLLEGYPDEILAGIDLQRIDLELRTAAFLTRTGDGHYSFSHKSFREFFYARHLLDTLRQGPEPLAAALATAALTPECVGFLADLMEEKDFPPLAEGTRGILAEPYRARISENALRLAYHHAAARAAGAGDEVMPLPDGMKPLMPEAPRLEGARLGEAALPFAWLAGAQLAEADLHAAELSGARLDGADLHGARLDHARLEHATLDGARLTKASLRFIAARHASLRAADLSGSDLTAARLTDTRCESVDLRGANLHGARLARAGLDGARWEGAELTALTLPGAAGEPPPLPRTPSRPRPRLRLGHGGLVTSAAFSNDGLRIVTASHDNTA